MRKLYLIVLGLIFFSQSFAQYKHAKISDIPVPFVNNASYKTIEYLPKAGVNDYISLEPEKRYMADEWGDTLINFTPVSLSYLGDVNGDGYDDFYYNAGYAGDGDSSNLDAGAYKALIVYGGSDLNNLQKTVMRTNLRPAGDLNGDGFDDAIGWLENPLSNSTTTWTYYWGSVSGLVKHSEEYSGQPLIKHVGVDLDKDGYEDIVNSTNQVTFSAANIVDFDTISVDPSSFLSGDYGTRSFMGEVNDTLPSILFYDSEFGQDWQIVLTKFNSIRELVVLDTITLTNIDGFINNGELADINGDGFKEIIFYNSNDSTYYISKGSGDTLYSNKPVAITKYECYPAGDVNNDGSADLLYRDNDNNWHLIYGNTNIELVGNDTYEIDYHEYSVRGIGDINGDNNNDIIFKLNNDTIVGQKVVVGGNTISYEYISYKKEDYSGDDFVQTVNLGDINGDGYDDIAYHSFEMGGKSFIYTNTNEQVALILDMEINQRLKKIIGEDINGDGFSDILVLIYNDEIPESSRVNIYLGGSEIDSEIDKVIMLVDYYTNDFNAYLESTINGIGDINNDGIADFTLSYDDLYIFYGGKELYTTADIKLDLNQSFCARQIEKLEDINDDGIDDFAICSPFERKVNIYYGQGAMASADDYIPSLTLVPDTFVGYGFLVYTTGDFNGDNYKDIALIPYEFYDQLSDYESLTGLNIFYLGPDADTIPDKLFKIPASPFGINSIDYINRFYGDFSAIPDINGDHCDELFICPNVSSKLPIGYAKAGYNGNIYLGGEYLVQDSLPAYQLKGFPYPYSFGTSSEYFYSNYTSAYGDFNNNGIKELMVVDRNKNFRGVPISMFPLGNHYPTDILLSNNTMENLVLSGTEIGVLSAVDGDIEDTHIYALVKANNGNDADNSKFFISVNKLLAAANLNPDTQTEYKINIKVEDSYGDTLVKSFIIKVEKVSGIIDHDEGKQITIYPNPAHDGFNILLDNSDTKTVSIIDLSGKTCYTKKTSESKLEIDVSQLSNGLYIVKVEFDDKIIFNKFIKQ